MRQAFPVDPVPGHAAKIVTIRGPACPGRYGRGDCGPFLEPDTTAWLVWARSMVDMGLPVSFKIPNRSELASGRNRWIDAGRTEKVSTGIRTERVLKSGRS
jgi:hypothetical protein